jgi:hypothetical protein
VKRTCLLTITTCPDFTGNTDEYSTSEFNLSAAKILIFDIETTLANTLPVHYEARQEICRNHGFKCTRLITNSFILPLFVFLALLILPEPKLMAATYYFDSVSGNDNNKGTSQNSPWKTISKMNNKTYVAGDVINLKAGSGWAGTLLVKNSGADGSPITIQSYGTGSKPIFSNTATGINAVNIRGSWIIIDGLSVIDTPFGGFVINSTANHVVIQNVEVSRSGAGVWMDGQYGLVTKSYFHDLIMVNNTPKTTNPDDDYGAIGVVIENQNNEVSYNTMENCKAPSYDYGTDGGAVEIYGNGSGSYIHCNYAIHNNGFMEVGSGNNSSENNITLAYNVSIDNGDLLMMHYGEPFGCTYLNFNVENNTIVENKTSGTIIIVWSIPSSPVATFRNNIIYSKKTVSNTNQITHDHNLFYLPTNANLGFTLNSTEQLADPLFVNLQQNNFHITSASPARGKGINIGLTTDIDGNSVSSTPDLGAYQFTLSQSVKDEHLLSKSVNLLQNYPNPFNQTTTIPFSLPSKSFVTLKVFDLTGKEVTTIVSEEMPAGKYSRQWDAANRSGGIYFYRLQAGSFSETKKLILIR